MFPVIATISLSYVSCAGFFHAHPKRSAWSLTRDSERASTAVRLSSWVLLFAAFLPLTAVQSVEKAIPTWLAVILGTGVVNLLAAIFRPRIHLWSGVIAGGVALFSSVLVMVGI
ncbi:MAG: hypothetical protein AAF552_17010 [Pseudomonadota bacterium]